MISVVRLLSLAVLLTVPAAAQEYRANLHGTVWNEDGSRASGVPLVIVSESTGEARRVVSGSDGRYTVAGLLPGIYRIEATDTRQPEFAIRTSVSISQDRQLDLRLGLVPITADADVRPTFIPVDRSALFTTTLGGAFITRLPFDGRNFLDAVLLAPGMAPGEAAIASNGTSDLFAAYLIDGFYDIDPRLGTPAVRPQLDAIDEMEVRAFPLDATFGRTAGAQVNVATKSGTNELHGGGVGFFRSDANRAQLGAFAGGPLAANRTFVFGNYEFTDDEDATTGDEPSHLAAVRLDQIVGGSARVIARYGRDRNGSFDRTGQSAGVSGHLVIGNLANESRASLSRVSFGGSEPLAVFSGSETYQLANVTTKPLGAHLFTAGAEWYGARRGLDTDDLSATVWGLFLQDDFRASSAISVTIGGRFDRAASSETDENQSSVSPRVGVAWAVDREEHTIVRGGYGLLRNYTIFEAVAPKLDAWSIGVQRQIGRARTIEAAYVATRGEDLRGAAPASRYDALQFQLQQRSDTGLTILASYTLGKWTESFGDEMDSARAPLDSRQRLAVALAAGLPFGKDRRWFTRGIAATIFGDMELTGVFTMQTGRPLFVLTDGQRASHRNLDGALVKSVAVGDRRTLQLRAETFNLTNRDNPLGPGRRYQFGGRVLF